MAPWPTSSGVVGGPLGSCLPREAFGLAHLIIGHALPDDSAMVSSTKSLVMKKKSEMGEPCSGFLSWQPIQW